ncbi:hypothetical protein TKK_0009400 [Trichogramma kaykai]|uniref:Rab3 GTPase-activating protein non-catalytic subunit n=1 Tax=Trichogramma kaykai TaxID=54128 RepID=A0ABD2WZA7_9HYME
MSCQIKGIANLLNPVDVKTRLLGDTNYKKFERLPANVLPLHHLFVSLSPVGDVLALAWNTRLVILTSKWDSQETDEVKNKFHVVWDGDVTSKQHECITSVICLPLIAYGKTNSGVGADWTCIVVGLSSGFVKFYTETGALLLEEQLHSESIVNIKCQSYRTPRNSGETGTQEEIYILYNTVICILQGFTLFSTLRAYRNHLARVKANYDVEPPAANLVCKKWCFKNHDFINDTEVIGSTSVNIFDHLMTASVCGGFTANYRSSAPQHSLVMAIGKRPYIGFHYALEGGAAPVLSDVAIAMASKVANAIGAAVPWFRSSSKSLGSQDKIKGVLSDPPEPMTCRFGLSDIMREGDTIVVSPNKLLSVVTDVMGRVILVDNKQGIAIRMWKGYRRAECGWIEALEEKQSTSVKGFHGKNSTSNSSRRRTALFLVIYAPKKGVIDIWSVQYGHKITTFSASKKGRLLYTNYGLCGLNNTSIASGNQALHPCVFIDPLGGIREITVPFHFALNSQSSNKARDIHLFRKLKMFLREEDFDEAKLVNEVTNTCLELKTNEVRLQTIEMLMMNKHITPDSLIAAINCFSKQLDLQEDDDSELATKTMYHMVNQLKRAIKFYKYVRYQYDKPPEYSTVASDNVPDGKQLSSILFTSEREIHRILKLSKTINHLKNSHSKNESRVTFKEDGKTFLDFISCFDFGTPGSLGLHKDVSYDLKCQISKLLFQGWMYSNDPISKWQENAQSSDIQPGVLIQFAMLYWLNKNQGAPLEIELVNFTKLLFAICSFIDPDDICRCNEASRWWKDVQNILIQSTQPFNALTAAIACRAVAASMQRNKDTMKTTFFKDDNGNDDEKNGNKLEKMDESADREDMSSIEDETISNHSDWENVSKDTCQFSLLAGNLEDIAILDAIVSNPPTIDDSTRFHALPYETPSISLAHILSKGKGSVSEAVAKWLISTGVDPAHLIDTTDIEFDQVQLSVDTIQYAVSLDEAKALEVSQQNAKSLLTLSVEVGSEAKPEQTSMASVLDKVTLLKRHFPYSLTSSVLLANLCWEYVISWSKDVTQLENLEAALSILRQIPFKRIRHGVSYLLWSIHLKKKMEFAAKLINKCGKIPKERLCMQDTGLSDTQLTTLLQQCVLFLNIFLDAEILEEENCSFVRSEELWEGHTASGPQPFSVLAISQPPASYDLLMLHLQLANVLHMIAHFNLKFPPKPINNLFDSLAHQYFFQEISNVVVIPWYKDEKRDNSRMEFLCRVITASMESIHQDTSEIDNYSSRHAIIWMSNCQSLAYTWKINNDELRIHQACQLYINGLDRLAEEVVIAVNDTERMASNLLPIAGGRMVAYLAKVNDLLQEVSQISPALSAYLQGLSANSQNLVLTNCSNEDTVELVKLVSRNLPETHSDYYIAQLMLDATCIYQSKTPKNVND